jgi:hypothetical protein
MLIHSLREKQMTHEQIADAALAHYARNNKNGDQPSKDLTTVTTSLRLAPHLLVTLRNINGVLVQYSYDSGLQKFAKLHRPY